MSGATPGIYDGWMPTIRPYVADDRAAVLALSLRAWAPVFELTEQAMPGFIYESFYPAGWEKRQVADLSEALDSEPQNIDVAVDGDELVGWVCTRVHPDDSMGEIYILAVDPQRQREGIGAALMQHSLERARAAGMRMMMVETGGDPGHAPARTAYEAAGFEQLPIARYFTPLD